MMVKTIFYSFFYFIREWIYFLFKKPEGLGYVMMLHRVNDNISDYSQIYQDLVVESNRLEKLLVEVSNYFDVIPLTELSSRLKNKAKGRKFIVFTFDDGYKDVYTKAYPIFKKYNIPFTVFIATDFLDKNVNLEWDRDNGCTETDEELCMSWDELGKMAEDSLVTIGGHSVSHKRLSSLSYEQSRNEILDSCNIIKQRIGRDVEYFSYPFGDAGNNENKIVSECSRIKMSFLASGGPIIDGEIDYTRMSRMILTNKTDVKGLRHYKNVFMGI